MSWRAHLCCGEHLEVLVSLSILKVFHFRERVNHSKLLKVKGSGAEARAEGPFLQWQNRSCEAAKAPRERAHPSVPPPPRAGKREVPTSGSSDSAGADPSVTAAKPLTDKSSPQGARATRSAGEQSRRGASRGQGAAPPPWLLK